MYIQPIASQQSQQNFGAITTTPAARAYINKTLSKQDLKAFDELVFSQRNCSNKIELFMHDIIKGGKKVAEEFRASFCLKEYVEGPGENALTVVKRLVKSI